MSRRKTILTAIVLILIMLIGGMLAFFTDKADTNTKVFNLGNVKIDFTEATKTAFGTPINNITPQQVTPLTAKLENKGANDAYIFVKIEMPYSNVSINGAEAEKKDLFTTDISSNWKEIAKSSDSKEDEDNHLYTHIYAYVEDGDSSNQLKKLQKYSGSGEEYSTASIFNEVTFVNATKPEEISSNFSSGLNIKITGYAIQADNINTTNPEDAWSYLKTNLKEQ